MKVSKEQLKALIKEELEAVMKEAELEEAGKRGGKAQLMGLGPDELAGKAERAKELKGVETTERAKEQGRAPKAPKKDRPFGGDNQMSKAGTAKGAYLRTGYKKALEEGETELEEGQEELEEVKAHDGPEEKEEHKGETKAEKEEHEKKESAAEEKKEHMKEDKQMEQIAESFRRFTKILKG